MGAYCPCGTRNFNYKKDMAIVRTPFHWAALVILLLLLFLFPTFFGGVLVNLVNEIAIITLAVMGLNILTGLCGQISLGQSAFMCVGAYTTGILAATYNIHFLVALPCGALGAGIIGLVFGLPSVKIKGFYIAMATLAAQFIIPALIATPLEFITNGSNSLRIPSPELGGIVFNSPQSMFYIIIPITVIMVFFAENLTRTGIGRAFVAIRDDDLAADVMGIDIFRYKLLAFFVCAVYAGMAGGLWAYWLRSINPDHFHLHESIKFLGMLVVGGMGSIPGAVFGVSFLLFMDYFVREFGMQMSTFFPMWAPAFQQASVPLLYGLVIVLFLIFEPRGLAHRWTVLKSSYRLRPFSY
ncbi:MAG: branched-chain amino acid ABC transporter permease [Desulfobacterales bacterium]|nr:branched-chain amino acid ABC transporter permease [Desulfobacterales bacterium]